MPSNPRPRILYVDNDEDSRVMLSTLLEGWGIEARTVSTAAQVLSFDSDTTF